LKHLPREVSEADKKCYKETPKDQLSCQQSVEEILRIVQEAKSTPRPSSSEVFCAILMICLVYFALFLRRIVATSSYLVLLVRGCGLLFLVGLEKLL
jgi:hypothetical protein